MVRADLAIAAATVLLARAAEEQRSTFYAAVYLLSERCVSCQILKKKTGTYLRAFTAVKYLLGYSTRHHKFKRLEPYLQLSTTGSASKEDTETVAALLYSREFYADLLGPYHLLVAAQLRSWPR